MESTMTRRPNRAPCVVPASMLTCRRRRRGGHATFASRADMLRLPGKHRARPVAPDERRVATGLHTGKFYSLSPWNASETFATANT